MEVQSIVSKISGLTSFLKRSPQKASSFTDIVTGILGKKLSMIANVSTRWNSTYDMLKRALKLRACIAVFCENHHLSEKYNLTSDEWKKVQQLCNFLEPLSEATETVSPEKTTMLVLAAPVYIALISKLSEVCLCSSPFKLKHKSKD
jgi:hypothetical protein